MSGFDSVPTIKIAEMRGDLILQVGDTEAGRVQLLVSSATLKQVSKVFVALLGPNFREGQAEEGDQPHKIELHGDNATVVQDMCNLLHMKVVPDLMKPVPDPLRVLHLAVVIDKYGCVEVLGLQLLGLLSAISVGSPIAEHTQIIAAAAYLLDHGRMFREVTKHWIMNGFWVQPVRELEAGGLSQILLGRVFDESRARAWCGAA